MNIAPKRRWFQFVEDGCSRAQGAIEPKIRLQVMAEYSERLQSAGPWGRFWLRREIEHEVMFRLNQVAPPEALY